MQDNGDLVAYKIYDELYFLDPKNVYFLIQQSCTGYRTFAVANLLLGDVLNMPQQPILLFDYFFFKLSIVSLSVANCINRKKGYNT